MTHDSLIITQSLQGIHSRTHHSHQNPRPPRSSPELATARVPARRLLSPSMSCKQLAALCGSGSEGRRTVCMFSARVSLIRGCWNPGVQQPWKWPADHLFFTDVETQPHSQPARWPLLHHVSHSVFRARTFPGGVDAGPLTVVPRCAPPLSSSQGQGWSQLQVCDPQGSWSRAVPSPTTSGEQARGAVTSSLWGQPKPQFRSPPCRSGCGTLTSPPTVLASWG